MANKEKVKNDTLAQKNEKAFLKKIIATHLKGKISAGELQKKIDNLNLTVKEKKTLNLADIRLQKQSLKGLQVLFIALKIKTDTLEKKIILLQYRLANQLNMNFTQITFSNLAKYLVKTKSISKINGWDFGTKAQNGLKNQSYKFVNDLCSSLQPYTIMEDK